MERVNKVDTIETLVITYGSAIVLNWVGYLLHWVSLVAAVGISLVLLGLFGVASWLVSYVNR